MKHRIFFLALLPLLVLSACIFGAPPPTNPITSISPRTGTFAGGTVVTITGTLFTGATDVTFDGVSATSFVVNNDNSITATTPPHTPQVVFVVVTAPGGSSISTQMSMFTYTGPWQAYVTNSLGNSISAINVSTDLVAQTIPGGNRPSTLGITPDGSQAYIANFFGQNVSVIDTLTNTITTTVPVGQSPNSISITPNGSFAYVDNINSGTTSIITTANNTVVNTVPVVDRPIATAILPIGTQAYVAGSSGNTPAVSVIDTTTQIVSNTIPLAQASDTIASTPDSSQIYLSQKGSNIVAIDVATGNATYIFVDNFPNGLAITPDGNRVYVPDGVGNVAVVDTATNSVIDTIFVGTFSGPIAITPNGQEAYVIIADGNVLAINTASNVPVNMFTAGTNPVALSITADGKKVYVVNKDSNDVTVFDTFSSDTSTIAVGVSPTMIGITPDQAPLANFVSSSSNLTISLNASASNSPTGTIKDYFWDFGDGNTLHTANALTNHTYASNGNYLVTLTVTNTGGTSTSQIYSYNSQNVNASTYSMPMTNNGGPTATISQFVSVVGIPPNPPQNFHGKRKKNQYLNETEFLNILTWDAPVGGNVTKYAIYRDIGLQHLVGIIPAGAPLIFEDRFVEKKKTYTYFIIAVNDNGASLVVGTVVTPKNKKVCDNCTE